MFVHGSTYLIKPAHSSSNMLLLKNRKLRSKFHLPFYEDLCFERNVERLSRAERSGSQEISEWGEIQP